MGAVIQRLVSELISTTKVKKFKLKNAQLQKSFKLKNISRRRSET